MTYAYILTYIHPCVFICLHRTLHTYIHTYIIGYKRTYQPTYLPSYVRARFIVSLRPSFLPGPELGALLSSYLEGALYKFDMIDREIER